MFLDVLRAIRKIYISHNIVLWLVLLILPVVTSVFMVNFFSAEIIQHVPIGLLKQDRSQLADKVEMALRADPVLEVAVECHDRSECEHAVIRGDLQAFIVLPYDMERRALRLETPVIPVYSSGQNYLTNTFAVKEIRSVISAIGVDMFTKQARACDGDFPFGRNFGGCVPVQFPVPRSPRPRIFAGGGRLARGAWRCDSFAAGRDSVAIYGGGVCVCSPCAYSDDVR